MLVTKGTTTKSLGLKSNLLELAVGFESATAVRTDNVTETVYANASVTGWTIAMVYVFIATGEYVPSPNYAY